MTVGSISFWQQDQNFWTQGQQNDQAQAQSTAVMNVMANAVTTLSSGLASIANQTALDRVNSALTAAVQSALQSTSGSTASSSSGTATSSAANASSSGPSSPPVSLGSPAIGTGTVPLVSSASLFSLGILANGTVTVGDGTFTTKYTSTGHDTVGDLIGALNTSNPGHANVAAWLDSSGKLVISGKDDVATITVGGNAAAAVGFGSANASFQPTAPSSAFVAPSSSSSSSTSSTASGTSGSTGSSTTALSSIYWLERGLGANAGEL
jgi:hypothetical protein